ncbi:hypothetical protein [Nocardia lijiangensis]|uniref:hypothetical protein n=1 Tax=Nocardia lijiangensis TaxID=299618 RepID=UPI003D75FD16
MTQAIDRFNNVGACTLLHGWAQDIATLISEPVDIISASALLHEVYSYGGAYTGLHTMMRTFPKVLKPYGFFVYRDVYAVAAPSLHERAVQSYSTQSWLQFVRMFLPHYLHHGTHPYHHHDDEIVIRQDSRIVAATELNTRVCAVIDAPIGLFRETQRHYITLRDHVWRSGVLGFTPVLDGQLAGDWIDFRTGHKRVHFSFTDSDWMSATDRANIQAVSEPYGDHHVIDGDIFDAVTDVALNLFLTSAERDDQDCARIWGTWLEREGRETYAYLTADELLTAFAVNSVEAEARRSSVLMPVQQADVFSQARHYYNRFLTKRLPNPLTDAKQMILFQNIPVTDAEALQQALANIRHHCSKPNLARVHTAIHARG